MPENEDIELPSRNKPQDGDLESSEAVSAKSTGLYFSLSVIITILIGTALVFTGAILATYYGKTCPNCPATNFEIECGDYYCSNQNVLTSNTLKCF